MESSPLSRALDTNVVKGYSKPPAIPAADYVMELRKKFSSHATMKSIPFPPKVMA